VLRPPPAVVRFYSRIHQWLYRWSGGRLFASLGPARVLVLETRGRRTGAVRRSPLFFIDHDRGWVVAASNVGRDEHPAWYHNVRADRRAAVYLGGDRYAVDADEVPVPLRAALWPRFVGAYPAYARYQASTPRQIPLVVLRRR